MTYLVLGVVFSTAADASRGPWAIIAPACTSLSVGAVAGHMAGIATHSADDASSKVLLLRAVVLAVSYLSTVLASLVLIVTQSSVQSGELTELVTLQFVLALGNGSSLWVLVFAQQHGVGSGLTVSMTLWISFLALLTLSSVSAMIKQWRSSSWLLA